MQLGDVVVTKVVEFAGEFMPAQRMIPGSAPELWQRNRDWLVPEHWEPGNDNVRGAVRTWVLRSEGRTILVDTGVGNDRDRPQIPMFDHLRSDFLDRLAAAGVRPEDVDIVVNTHIHYDHVGWNTEWRDDAWVPAFPRAQYVIPLPDKEFFDPANAGRRRAPRDEAEKVRQYGSTLVYADSIAPILDRAVLWEGEYRLDGNLTLEAAPGHTPGSSVLRLSSGTDRAAFVGDMLHSPVQILQPAHNSCFCEDTEAARATRRRVLERAADNRELVIPAHFGGTGAAEIRRDGSNFSITRWAE